MLSKSKVTEWEFNGFVEVEFRPKELQDHPDDLVVKGCVPWLPDRLKKWKWQLNGFVETEFRPNELQDHPDDLVVTGCVAPAMVTPWLPESLKQLETIAKHKSYLKKFPERYKWAILKNEEMLYRTLQGKRRSPKLNSAQKLQAPNSLMPFTRQGWQAASFVATEVSRHFYQILDVDDGKECVRLAGVRGNNQEGSKRPYQSRVLPTMTHSCSDHCIDALIQRNLKPIRSESDNKNLKKKTFEMAKSSKRTLLKNLSFRQNIDENDDVLAVCPDLINNVAISENSFIGNNSAALGLQNNSETENQERVIPSSSTIVLKNKEKTLTNKADDGKPTPVAESNRREARLLLNDYPLRGHCGKAKCLVDCVCRGSEQSCIMRLENKVQENSLKAKEVEREQYSKVVNKLNILLKEKMGQIKIALESTSKLIPSPKGYALCIRSWMSFHEAFKQGNVVLWQVAMKDSRFIAATTQKQMPPIKEAIAVRIITILGIEEMPIFCRMLINECQAESTSDLGVVMQGRTNYWVVRGFLCADELSVCFNPTAETHPMLAQKINLFSLQLAEEAMRRTQQQKQSVLLPVPNQAIDDDDIIGTTSSEVTGKNKTQTVTSAAYSNWNLPPPNFREVEAHALKRSATTTQTMQVPPPKMKCTDIIQIDD